MGTTGTDAPLLFCRFGGARDDRGSHHGGRGGDCEEGEANGEACDTGEAHTGAGGRPFTVPDEAAVWWPSVTSDSLLLGSSSAWSAQRGV
mmetsp:Transcript_145177/g.256440  ORF Transcript_145177/g.256440 Transcript_145177/m.256440 type:complete len:90 (+) Transcript_145177:941-1210(+)